MFSSKLDIRLVISVVNTCVNRNKMNVHVKNLKMKRQPVHWFGLTELNEQVAQWATIAHHGASKMFGNTIIYDAQRQITLNLKQ